MKERQRKEESTAEQLQGFSQVDKEFLSQFPVKRVLCLAGNGPVLVLPAVLRTWPGSRRESSRPKMLFFL